MVDHAGDVLHVPVGLCPGRIQILDGGEDADNAGLAAAQDVPQGGLCGGHSAQGVRQVSRLSVRTRICLRFRRPLASLPMFVIAQRLARVVQRVVEDGGKEKRGRVAG